ncbi:unnamed protein product [Pleuronectes platessa]|uniref:Uncharacterized protein n=1 Tax=Pleuronectes platessa TaxID=8262 RepID=A0A9N7YNH4_PLEPL|nr:unnamed protein product [Pleuronectes platessa]
MICSSFRFFDLDTQSELISPVTAVRAADLKIAPRKSKPSSGAAGLESPPVTYMHICETEVFSMGDVPAEAAARPHAHERESAELLIRRLPSSASSWPAAAAHTELKLLLLH